MSIYPPGWPQCAFCDKPALDGHLTCGSAGCPEWLAREIAARERRLMTSSRDRETERQEAIERERGRDEIRQDPTFSRLVKKTMEHFWQAIDRRQGLPGSGERH